MERKKIKTFNIKLRQFKCRCSYRPEANKCGAVHNNLNGCTNVQR